MSCNYKHEDIGVLYGVEPTSTDQLPKVCVCGAEITYAEKVCFVSLPKTSYPDWIIVDKLDMKESNE